MRTADYIFQFLADRGVRDVFMVSGGGAMFLNDALGSEPRLPGGLHPPRAGSRPLRQRGTRG